MRFSMISQSENTILKMHVGFNCLTRISRRERAWLTDLQACMHACSVVSQSKTCTRWVLTSECIGMGS